MTLEKQASALVKKIDQLVGPLATDKPCVFYVFDQIERIGHIAAEFFTLRSLFPLKDFHLVVLIGAQKVHAPHINHAVFNAFSEGITLVEVEDNIAAWLGQQTLGLVENDDRQYLLVHAAIMLRMTMTQVMANDAAITMQLNEQAQLKGLGLKKKLGVDIEAPLVTLHVRESGYIQNAPHHAYRDANIERYLPLVHQLLAEGYVVMRIGDASMVRLNIMHPNFIDAPFHPHYDSFMDLYLTASSRLFIGTFSGPQSISLAYNTPSLIVNAPISSIGIRAHCDLLVPKKFYSRRARRALSYEEIVITDLPDCTRSEHFSRKGITLLENSSDEIIAGFQELNARIDNNYEINDTMATRIAQINSIGHIVRQQTLIPKNTGDSPLGIPIDFYAPALSKSDISQEYIKINPDFLHSYTV